MYAVYSNAVNSRNLNTFRNRASLIKPRKEKTVKQQEWGRKSEYILSLIGFAVGIGNIWRFPYLAQEYGGGAFLLAYIVMVVVEGLPLFCLELAIGNHFKKGATGCMKAINKYCVGIGWCTIMICFLCTLYYNSVIMWIIRYLFESFVNPLPWSQCQYNHTCCLQDRTQFYWYYTHLGIDKSGGMEDMGEFDPTLVVCLVFSWLLIFVCMARGIATSGKVVYFSATAPYVVLLILLLRGVTLPGAADGIKLFVLPSIEELWNLKLWAAAASQIFYSLGIGFGALISFASFTKNCDNVVRDSVIITIVNCSTSILGGFVIFSIIGYRKTLTDQAFSELKSGPGLAFVAIAEAVANMHISSLWAILFYCMLLLLGVDSLFGMLESMLHQLREEVPVLRQVKKHGLSAAVCAAMFLMALPTTMNGGLYVIEMMDNWAVTMPLLVAALGEIISVMWIYGIHRFVREVKEKSNITIGYYWQICWMVISPLILIVILVASLIDAFKSLSYEKFVGCTGGNSTLLEGSSNSSSAWIESTPLPPLGMFIALTLLFLPVLMIPLGAVAAYCKKDEGHTHTQLEAPHHSIECTDEPCTDEPVWPESSALQLV